MNTRKSMKYHIGQKVSYEYARAAISCEMQGRIKGSGSITGFESANGTLMYVIDNYRLIFEHEVLMVEK